MTNYDGLKVQVSRGILLVGCATVLAVAFTMVRPRSVGATHHPVPSNIQVPAGNSLFLEAHAVGTQNYICLPLTPGPGFGWTLFGPQATLFDDDSRQVTTHFLSPNPVEGGTLRATWKHSRDSSTVWALAEASSSDPAFVAPNAIPWLRLKMVGVQAGPTGGGKLRATSYIQRVKTVGGVAPSTGCTLAAQVGARAFVPYKADYLFFTKHIHDDNDDN